MNLARMLFALPILVGSTPGNDTNVGPKKVEANRNFANKFGTREGL